MPVGILWGIRPNFFGLSPCWRQVAYALRTRPPVAGRSTEVLHPMPLDLHVLGLPLAFILSQDQTLHCKKIIKILESWLLKFPLKELINTALYLFFSNNTSNSKNLFRVLKRSQKSLKKSLGILSESDCKDKRSYLNFQIFQRKIREPHFKNLPAKPCCFRLAGANVGTFSDSPNFRELFLRFSCIFPVLILQVPAHDPEQITD